MSHRTLTVLTLCFNEVANVGVLAERVAAALADQADDYRHVFIDKVMKKGSNPNVCGYRAAGWKVW